VQTAQLLDDAYNLMRTSAEKGQKFLFVGTKRQAAGIVAQEALRCGANFVNQRWLGGMLTNWATIKTRCDRLKRFWSACRKAVLWRCGPRKKPLCCVGSWKKLQKYLGGIKTMRRLPDVVVIIDTRREYNAVQECQKLDIPIVSLLDTNCDPNDVDIPIPANDDAIRSIKLILGKLADAIYEGSHGRVDEDAYADYDDADEGYDL
jgi:small subunit ribosomal protein S2